MNLFRAKLCNRMGEPYLHVFFLKLMGVSIRPATTLVLYLNYVQYYIRIPVHCIYSLFLHGLRIT